MDAQRSQRRDALSHFSWDDLNTVLAVVRAGSLSAAARTLGVNHSTVSRRLSALEKATGHTLFRRLARGYVATAAGEQLVAAAERMESEVEGLRRLLSGRDISLSGTVRLTAPDDSANHLLAGALARFAARFPGIKIEMAIDNRLFNLSRREADVAVRATRSPPPGLVGRRVATLAATVYASRDYLARVGERNLTRDRFAAQSWIAWEEDQDVNVLNALAAQCCPPAAVVYRSNSVANQYAAARAGLGLAALPCFLGDPDPQLVRLLPPQEEASTDLWLLTHSELASAARIAALMESLAADLAKQQALLAGEGPAPPAASIPSA